MAFKGLTQRRINELAADNFAKEMRKHRSFFKKHGVVSLIFTDDSLKDTQELFDDEIRPYLEPATPEVQLSFQMMEEFFAD
jgi:hypothetical protein